MPYPTSDAPHVCHLAFDAVHGTQRRARQLWDDAPAFSPVMAAQFLLTKGSHIYAVKHHLSRDLRSCGQRTEERLAERRLPAAALPDDRRHAACRKVCTHMIECGHTRVSIDIAHSQITYGKALSLHIRHPRTSCRTSKR